MGRGSDAQRQVGENLIYLILCLLEGLFTTCQNKKNGYYKIRPVHICRYVCGTIPLYFSGVDVLSQACQ